MTERQVNIPEPSDTAAAVSLFVRKRWNNTEIKEFGREHPKKIVLIPGCMMCWKQFDGVIPYLARRYHVIAVSTDGFDGTSETTFTTAENTPEKLAVYIK